MYRGYYVKKTPAYMHLEIYLRETIIFVFIHTGFSICLKLKHVVQSIYAAVWCDNYPEKIE